MTEQDNWDLAISSAQTIEDVSNLATNLPWQKYQALEARVRFLTSGERAKNINEDAQELWDQVEESIFAMRVIKILDDPQAPADVVAEARALAASVKAANLRRATNPPRRGDNAVAIGLNGRPKKFLPTD